MAESTSSSGAQMSSKLDEWESKAKDTIEYHGSDIDPDQKKFLEQYLTLIELVRKKDEALRRQIELVSYCGCCASTELAEEIEQGVKLAEQAIALTENLK